MLQQFVVYWLMLQSDGTIGRGSIVKAFTVNGCIGFRILAIGQIRGHKACVDDTSRRKDGMINGRNELHYFHSSLYITAITWREYDLFRITAKPSKKYERLPSGMVPDRLQTWYIEKSIEEE